MIDAISGYSSNHVYHNRNKSFGDDSPKVLFAADTINISEKTPQKKQSELGAFLFISGCAGAFCMILNFLLNSENLLKSDFGAIKSILKASALVAIVSGACFAGFKGLEKLIDKPEKTEEV